MKTNQFIHRRNLPLLILLMLFISHQLTGQAPPTVFAEVRLIKVEPGKGSEFEKMMKETFKPVAQMRKQNGKITGWALYKVDFAGANEEYNYATVHNYASWDKTEPNENIQDLLKAANPKADAAATMAKATGLFKIVREAIYYRVDNVQAKTPAPVKYLLINFMKVKDDMGDAYVKSEQEDWKPIHQILSDEGKRAGWSLWSLAYPGGTGNSHNYVTVDAFSNYGQLNQSGYQEAFKKAHPDQEMTPMFQKIGKTRDLLRDELWELVESVQ